MRGRARVRMRGGFTPVELTVVIAIVVLLVAILLPSIQNAREHAQEAVCASNLAHFGRSFYLYADAHAGYLCSGAFDPAVEDGRDGPVDQVGWVADLVNRKLAVPGAMLCPSNPARANAKLGERNGAGYYAPEAARALIRRGYNTNYTQSWYMARREARWPPPEGDTNWARRTTTWGPLRAFDMGRAGPARLPLLGDGAVEADSSVEGGPTVQTMTAGPFGGPPFAIQDYSGFGPLHGDGSWISAGLQPGCGGKANVLFGDAHVGSIVDVVRDGRFALTAPTPEEPCYDQEDLGPEVFDGVLSLGRRSLSDWELK